MSTVFACLFHDVSLQVKVYLDPSASHDGVATQFSHYVKLTSKPGALPGSLGKNAYWAAGVFLAAIPAVASEQN